MLLPMVLQWLSYSYRKSDKKPTAPASRPNKGEFLSLAESQGLYSPRSIAISPCSVQNSCGEQVFFFLLGDVNAVLVFDTWIPADSTDSIALTKSYHQSDMMYVIEFAFCKALEKCLLRVVFLRSFKTFFLSGIFFRLSIWIICTNDTQNIDVNNEEKQTASSGKKW